MSRPNKSNWTRRLGPFNLAMMVCGLCEIFDGLLRVVSLGNLHWPNLTMRWLCWYTIWECRRRKDN